MGRQRKISGHVLAAMNNFLDNEKYIGQIARSADLLFITDGSWLKDTSNRCHQQQAGRMGCISHFCPL